MKRIYIPVILIVAVAAALMFYFRAGHTPSGQPPLEKLTAQNLVDIKIAFNADKNDVRVLLLLSPT